jgi:hypothetical protein
MVVGERAFLAGCRSWQQHWHILQGDKKNSPGIVHGSNGDDIDAIAITLHQFPQGTFGMNVGRHHKGVGQQVH